MAELSFPKLKSGYNGIKNAITAQEPRISLATLEPVVSGKQISSIMSALEANPSYNVLRGQINALASTAGLRINIIAPADKPGKLMVQIADKSIATTRELADEIGGIFQNPKNWRNHYKNAKEMVVNGFNSDKKGGVKMVLIDPKKPFADEVRNAVYDVIESREFAKHK